MGQIIFNIIAGVIVAIMGVIAKDLLPLLEAKKTETLTSLRKTRWAWAADIIDAAVRAVEQTVSGEIHGEDKKKLAVYYVMPILMKYGITMKTEEVSQLIEAAVQAMNCEMIGIPEEAGFMDEVRADENMPE